MDDTKKAAERELMDDDGENQAVRAFLQLYGCNQNPSVQQMREHLTESGFDGCWPEWADAKNFVQMAHITKSGAQDWLRHLFGLESSLSPPAVQVPEAGVVAHGCHRDLEDGMTPDGCVIDIERRQDCVYASRHETKEQCEYWRPIRIAAPSQTGDE